MVIEITEEDILLWVSTGLTREEAIEEVMFYREIERRSEESQSNKPLQSPTAEQHANTLAALYISKGLEAAAEYFNTLTVQFKIKAFEAVILADRVRSILITKGVKIRRPLCQ